MLGSFPAQSGELRCKCQGTLPNTRALLPSFTSSHIEKAGWWSPPTHNLVKRATWPKIFLSQWPRQTHGAHMAGTWPAQFPAQFWCPRVVLEEFGVRLEEGITIWVTMEQLRGRVANDVGRPEPVGTPMEQELRSLHATHLLELAMMEARGVSMVRRPREERARQRQAIFGPWERRFRVEAESRVRMGQVRDSEAFARAAARMEEVGRLGCEGEDPRFH